MISVKIAVDDILEKGVLSGHNFTVDYANTACYAVQGIGEWHDIIYTHITYFCIWLVRTGATYFSSVSCCCDVVLDKIAV